MTLLNSILKLLLKVFFDILFLFNGKPKLSNSLKKAVDLYKNQGFGSLFSEIRTWDAPYEETEKIVPQNGTILDIGSGDGLFANYLALSSPRRKVIGVDLRKTRVKMGQRGVKNTKFIVGDALKVRFPEAGCAVMFHFLHHVSSEKLQEKLISKVSSSLGKKGRLVIVEIADKPLFKYIFCFLVDAFILPILFDKKAYDFDFHYRKPAEWKKLLLKYGFTSQSRYIHRGMPFPHVIISATKI